ncbi:glycerol-3-phosphate 1-O-acyltransferase PlsY [Veillonella sp. AS16]|uniref:glycerol-3-phosphate 1-O-acyltransferase PlsY n=1 Tax=Veillonella sp. AS16 TaxID=936589 RepID=UPI0009FECAE8|nr:glycerol-3-phosphate 1-O-acyltransferase PlsY [Veillonella sp. AS16]
MDSMIIVYAILAYLIGSVPSGLIIGKIFFNTDVRQYGSKNIGATNTYRVIGLKAALPVFLCDALKGSAGVLLLSFYGPMYMILGGILAMIGHNWSLFLGFKGGRGVATGLGVLIALSPLVAVICLLVWGVIVYMTKLVSLGSIIAAVLVPFLMYFTGESYWFVGFGALAGLFVVIRHRDNIKRLLAGNELKVERIKKDE